MKDLVTRQSVLTMLNKIENAVEDGDGFQFNEWVEYAKDIPSAEKTENGDSIKIKERFAREIEYANKDIDFAEGTDESEENYMRGYLGGLLCAYRLVFGKSYEESEKK